MSAGKAHYCAGDLALRRRLAAGWLKQLYEIARGVREQDLRPGWREAPDPPNHKAQCMDMDHA